MLNYEWAGSHFYYDETSPTCIRAKHAWTTNGGLRREAGAAVGWRHPSGYYFVKIGAQSYSVHRLVWVLHHGNIDSTKPVDHRNRDRGDNRISNLRLVDRVLNDRNKRKLDRNTSGVTGVSYQELPDHKGGVIRYWRATWKDLNGRQHGKAFNIEKLGSEAAFQAACSFRLKQIELLNDRGAGYTDDHGD
jgi:hypothetical protein